jgi:FtsP/CotA-like multicopper oxidase with cupredoxin domain
LHGDHPSQEDGVFEQVGPNGTYTYDFIAQPAGALAYHCHVPPVMQHVRMGLYGAFIVTGVSSALLAFYISYILSSLLGFCLATYHPSLSTPLYIQKEI